MKLLMQMLRRLLRSKLQLIIQIPLASYFGEDEEMSLRDQLAESLEVVFQENDCGVFDGTDSGMGKTNLFIYEIPYHRWEDAFRLSMNELNRTQLEEKVTIAYGFMDEEELKVIWPSGFEGDFSVL